MPKHQLTKVLKNFLLRNFACKCRRHAGAWNIQLSTDADDLSCTLTFQERQPRKNITDGTFTVPVVDFASASFAMSLINANLHACSWSELLMAAKFSPPNPRRGKFAQKSRSNLIDHCLGENNRRTWHTKNRLSYGRGNAQREIQLQLNSFLLRLQMIVVRREDSN